MTAWNEPPHAIRVVARVDPELVAAARRDGADAFELSAGTCRSNADLLAAINRSFPLAHEAVNFSAAVGLLAEPADRDNPAGYLVVVTGLDSAAPEVAETIGIVAPYVSERSRTGGCPYVWMIESSSARDVVVRAMRDSNDSLAQSAADPDVVNNSGPVDVIVEKQ